MHIGHTQESPEHNNGKFVLIIQRMKLIGQFRAKLHIQPRLINLLKPGNDKQIRFITIIAPPT